MSPSNGPYAARSSLAAYFELYNAQRPRRAHGGNTPDQAYFAALTRIRQAA